MNLRTQGWRPSIQDSAELWAYHRKRAADLGTDAFILVGASRIQLGIDLGAIREMTHKEPVQLAINGTLFKPVLEDLASDPGITGTIMIAANAQGIKPYTTRDKSLEWVQYYREVYRPDSNRSPYRVIDHRVRDYLGSHMVTRLHGARPFTVISSLLVSRQPLRNYLTTDYSRSINADYTKVAMPDFYANRVRTNFGPDLFDRPVSYAEFINGYQRAIAELEKIDNRDYLAAVDELITHIQRIESRGGEVILVQFPTSKLIYEMDTRRYPRDEFWDQLKNRHQRSFHFEDYPEPGRFELPDGSHLDYRDKRAFTIALLNAVYQ